MTRLTVPGGEDIEIKPPVPEPDEIMGLILGAAQLSQMNAAQLSQIATNVGILSRALDEILGEDRMRKAMERAVEDMIEEGLLEPLEEESGE